MQVSEQPKETDKVKKKLEGYAVLRRKIENQIERLESFKATMGSPSAPNLGGMPGGGGDNASKTERQLIKKDEMERDLTDLLHREKEFRHELEAMIEKLERPNEQTVIEMRYIDGSSWWSICTALFSKKEDYIGKEESYLRRTFRIHGSALQHIRQICREIAGH